MEKQVGGGERNHLSFGIDRENELGGVPFRIIPEHYLSNVNQKRCSDVDQNPHGRAPNNPGTVSFSHFIRMPRIGNDRITTSRSGHVCVPKENSSLVISVV